MVLLPDKLQSSFTEPGKKKREHQYIGVPHKESLTGLERVSKWWPFSFMGELSLNISALCSLCFNVSVSKANLAASPSVCSTVRRANWFRQCERTDKHRHHPPLRPHTLPCLLSLNNPSPFTPPSEEEDLDPPFPPSSSLILSQLEAA